MQDKLCNPWTISLVQFMDSFQQAFWSFNGLPFKHLGIVCACECTFVYVNWFHVTAGQTQSHIPANGIVTEILGSSIFLQDICVGFIRGSGCSGQKRGLHPQKCELPGTRRGWFCYPGQPKRALEVRCGLSATHPCPSPASCLSISCQAADLSTRAAPWLWASGELRACDFETWPFSVLFVQKKVSSWLPSVTAED